MFFLLSSGYEALYSEVGYIDIGWVGPAGQLFSSVNDLSVLIKQYFAAYPSLFQSDIDDGYNFVVEPQTLREMLRPVFVNPDQQSGFGSPWEMQMLKGHFIRGKGGNINGFSAEIDMIPEMKLGLIALSNYGLDESMFTLPVYEILIPAFKSLMNTMQSSKFKPNLPKKIDDYVGYYFYEDVPLFQVFINNKTGNLMVVSDLQGLYGILTWMGDSVDNGNTFVYNDLYDDTESCWIKTLSGDDKSTIQFITDSNGNVTGAALYDNYYGYIFPKKNVPTQDINKWDLSECDRKYVLKKQRPKIFRLSSRFF